MKRYLVCYDISDPRRLTRVHKVCKNYGIALQYSVFLVVGDRDVIDELEEKLVGIIDERQDDIRIYPLKNQDNGVRIGMSHMPEDAWLISDGEAFDMTKE